MSGYRIFKPSLQTEYESICSALGVDHLRGVRETFRTNHLLCSDTRSRLYFTAMIEDAKQVVKAYCHNCQACGVIEPEADLSLSVYRDTLRTEDRSEHEPPGLPEDAVALSTHADMVPTAVHSYFSHYGISGISVNATWSESLGRICIPVWDRMPDEDGDEEVAYLGYIARVPPAPLISKRDTGSKWVVAQGRSGLRTVCGPHVGAGPGPIVFTEDLLSAYKVTHSRHVFDNIRAVPLFGLNVAPEYVLARMKQFDSKEGVVWLDNDAPSLRPRDRLAAVLRAFGYKARVVMNAPEPKKLSHEKIMQELEEAT